MHTNTNIPICEEASGEPLSIVRYILQQMKSYVVKPKKGTEPTLRTPGFSSAQHQRVLSV